MLDAHQETLAPSDQNCNGLSESPNFTTQFHGILGSTLFISTANLIHFNVIDTLTTHYVGYLENPLHAWYWSPHYRWQYLPTVQCQIQN